LIVGAGTGGVGGGAGSTESITGSGQGGGGFGAGGAILLDNGHPINSFTPAGPAGSLTILGPFSTGTGSNSNTTIGGQGAVDGFAAGDDFFVLTGAGLTLAGTNAPGGSVTIYNSIADDSPASFSGAEAGVTPGTASGATVAIGLPQNTGVVNFLGNNTYSGLTSVNYGTLVVNGSTLSPIIVNANGTLKGTGNIQNTVTVNPGGTVYPGNSIGTFTSGTLTLNNGAIFNLEIHPANNVSSLYNVLGSVSLTNPTLQLTSTGTITQQQHLYTFVQYTGTRAGSGFNLIVQNAPLGFQTLVLYLDAARQIQLQLTPFKSIIGIGVPLSHNEQNTLNYLLTLTGVPSLQTIFQSLSLLTPQQLRDALDSISPARNAAATYFTNQVAFAIGKIPLDRLAEGRVLRLIRCLDERIDHDKCHKKCKKDCPKDGKKDSIASTLATKNAHLLAMAESAPTPRVPAEFDQDLAYSNNSKLLWKPAGQGKTAKMIAKPKRYAFWATGFGDFISQDKQNSNPKINDTAAGALLGWDYYGCQNGIFVLSGGYVHNDITEGHHAGSGTSNGGVLSGYGTGFIGNGYLEAGLLAGYNRFHMKRNVVIGGPLPFHATAKSSFNNWMLMPHIGGGYDWMMNWGIVEPFASMDWVVSFQQEYKEKGAAPLDMKIRSQIPSILRSQVGLNVYETWDVCNGTVIFEQSASYINKAMFSTDMHASIIIPTPLPAGAHTSFSQWTYDKTLNLFGFGTEVFYKHKRTGFFVVGNYRGEFGSSYISNEVTGTLGVFF
jgi:uncharacterized protein with beta-barrel porin domain